KVRQVVVIEIDGNWTTVPELSWRIVGPVDGMRAVRVSVGLDVDAIVEVGDVVVGDDVPRTVQPNRRIGREDRRENLAVDAVELRPERADPSQQMRRVVAAEKIIVRDIKVARA